MAVLATDDFNRANENPLSGGGVWTTQTGEAAMAVVNNTCQRSSNTDCASRYSGVTAPADQYAQATMTVTAGNFNDNRDGPALLVRMQSSTQEYYRGVMTDTSGGSIVKRVAGVVTTLGTTTTNLINGATIRLEAQGTTLRLFQNGAQLISVTDAALSSGQFGIGYSSEDSTDNASLDNWEGGDFVTGPNAAQIAAVTRSQAQSGGIVGIARR